MSNIFIGNLNEAGSFIVDGQLSESGIKIIPKNNLLSNEVTRVLPCRLNETSKIRLDSIILKKTDGTTVNICLKPISREVITSHDKIKLNNDSRDLRAYVFCEDNTNFESDVSELDAESDFEDDYVEDTGIAERTQSNIDKAKKISHHLSNTPILCKHCGVLLPSLSQSKQHYNLKHNKTWSLQCDECDYKTKYSATLKRHKDMHKFHRGEIEKNHDCPVCGKKILHAYNLKTHMKLHELPKPFTCSLCGKQFTQKNNYLLHCRRHEKTNDQDGKFCRKHQFPCIECGKLFKWKHDAKKHYRNVHLRLLKFPCSQCNKAFADKSALNIHIASAHVKQKEFACSNCKKMFNNKYQLAGHIREKHNLEYKYEKQYKRSKNNGGKDKKDINIDLTNSTLVTS
ncbi:gastrula zinc finger protein XlCGF57.1-like [Dreissena polymorpha]|uniref:C2H2-type domain-containing protein n=1 Tax=Dreissena polymorpha TaxID=45954 RepID=A0A9D4M934_DREPO|nr:gastrula zinc finger protein XlCGF57.1-like [Dreissena polymorpha]KAH3872014.1 hypothetical protein DPMN_035227 [Dreissena polymorpha]